MNPVLQRLRQPSTWAALSALGLLFGVPPGTLDVITQAGVALTAVVGVVMNETGAPQQPPKEQ